MRTIPHPTPGEILQAEFIEPMGLTARQLAREIGVSQSRLGQIIAGKRAVTVDTGLRLSRYFGLHDAFWTGLQHDHDAAARDIRLG